MGSSHKIYGNYDSATLPAPKKAKGNPLIVAGEVAVMLCRSRGKVISVLIDAADVPLVKPYTWHVSWQDSNPRNIYVQTAVSVGRRLVNFRLHRLLLNTRDRVDHKNGRGTDNRRCNLRAATATQNNANMRHGGFKGVTRSGNRFVARTKYLGKYIHIGRFGTAEQAARAYDRKAVELFGEFAKTNF